MARLTFRRPAPEIRSAAPHPVSASVAVNAQPCAAAAEPADAAGCGWFDSSFDLWQGLEVREEPVAGSFAGVELWQLHGVAAKGLRRCAA